MTHFRRAVLLYNPVSGNRADRERQVRAVADILRPIADEFLIEPTQHAGTGTAQAQAAIAAGCDLIIAAGGDGTVFEILQGVANTAAALGVIPFGTGNVLAVDLALSFDPLAAAKAMLSYEAQRIAVGRITSTGREPKFFTVAAGVGVHAELIYNAGTAAKKRSGILAYYVSGIRLLFAHRFVPFKIEITSPDGNVVRDEVLELVAMRVSSFGRWLKRWRPGASLSSPSMQLVLLKQSSRWAMARYIFGALTGRAYRKDMTSRSADVSFVAATRVRCIPIHDVERIRAQADGEMLGEMPVELEILPNALTLLMPPQPPRTI
jgi:diacylglycerol kinase (ATP)